MEMKEQNTSFQRYEARQIAKENMNNQVRQKLREGKSYELIIALGTISQDYFISAQGQRVAYNGPCLYLTILKLSIVS